MYLWGLLLSLVAVVIVVLPLFKVRKSNSLAYKTSNVQLHEEKLSELNLDLQEDRIDQYEYKLARQELDRELLVDASLEGSSDELPIKSEVKKHPKLALAIAVFIPVLSFVVYMQLSHDNSGQRADVAGNGTEPSIEEMTAKLEQYLLANKGEFKDWLMLGRSYKYLGRYGEAANAFKAATSLQASPQVMLEHAEVLALLNGQKFNEEARELVLKALELAPDNLNALWFAGVAEFQFEHYRKAIEYLSQLSSVAAGDAEIERSLRFYIGQSREKLIAAGEEVAPLNEILPLASVEQAPMVNLTKIEVTVDISAKVRSKFSKADVVFVYAKAKQGPKMPLAVQRMTLADLPATIVLDDSMAMVDGMNLSAFKQVVISARVTKTGAAIAQSGDYIGQALVEDVSTVKNLKIGINELVP